MAVYEVHEERLKTLERQYTSIELSLKVLAEDMTKIVKISLQQSEDRSALKRAFRLIKETREKLDRNEIEQLHQKIIDQQEKIDHDAKNKRAAWFEILKITLVVSASLALYHFGIKLI